MRIQTANSAQSTLLSGGVASFGDTHSLGGRQRLNFANPKLKEEEMPKRRVAKSWELEVCVLHC